MYGLEEKYSRVGDPRIYTFLEQRGWLRSQAGLVRRVKRPVCHQVAAVVVWFEESWFQLE